MWEKCLLLLSIYFCWLKIGFLFWYFWMHVGVLYNCVWVCLQFCLIRPNLLENNSYLHFRTNSIIFHNKNIYWCSKLIGFVCCYINWTNPVKFINCCCYFLFFWLVNINLIHFMWCTWDFAIERVHLKSTKASLVSQFLAIWKIVTIKIDRNMTDISNKFHTYKCI